MFLLLSLLLIFIEHKSHRSSEINPEHNWNSRETSIATNDLSGPQHRSYYQPAYYNECQHYFYNRTTQKVSSGNVRDG